MPKLLKPSLKSIVAASAPPAYYQAPASVTAFPTSAVAPAPVAASTLAPAPAVIPDTSRIHPASRGAATLKERAKQMSVYLEPAVYEQLREIAYTERSKIHTLLLEGLDLLFRERGARSMRELQDK